VTYLKASGTLLGIFENLDFRKETVQLAPGDLLLIYSDGATEAMNEAKDFFGEERLEELMASLMDLPAARIVERVLEELALFTGDYPQTDDITLIAGKIL
jgi:sigma-B regulation protein RsbU (phosphoserine phosphatase)